MQRLEVSGAVRSLQWSLGVKWLITFMFSDTLLPVHTIIVDTNFINNVTVFCQKCFSPKMQPQLRTRGKAENQTR